jgi:hypothetical protein
VGILFTSDGFKGRFAVCAAMPVKANMATNISTFLFIAMEQESMVLANYPMYK